MKKTITIKNAKFVKPKKPLSKYKNVGVSVEKEHSPQKRVQRIIGANHADETAKKGESVKKAGDAYYKGLKTMEKALKKRKVKKVKS